MSSDAPPYQTEAARGGYDEAHHGRRGQRDGYYAAAGVEIAHRNDETQAESISRLRYYGYEVGLHLGRAYVGTYQFQQRLIVVKVGHREARHDGHHQQYVPWDALVFFQLYHCDLSFSACKVIYMLRDAQLFARKLTRKAVSRGGRLAAFVVFICLDSVFISPLSCVRSLHTVRSAGCGFRSVLRPPSGLLCYIRPWLPFRWLPSWRLCRRWHPPYVCGKSRS